MKSGLSVSVCAVTKLGSPYERDYMLELGLWPYKSKHARVWLSVMISGEGRSDYRKTWGLKFPSFKKLLRKAVWWKRDETEDV